ncbi:MAG: CoA-binding protein [Candidatus Undinarchaeales archaeon]
MNLEKFLKKENTFAVVGATTNKDKWGWKVFKNLKENSLEVYPVNPKYSEIDSDKCYSNLSEIPEKIDVAVTIVKPKVTEKIVKECKELGITKIWMQPGSESEKAVNYCKNNNIEVVHDVCMIRDVSLEEKTEKNE